MKKNIEDREKGITLVAIVVTIIVLLIIAGIAINLSIGNNGLFSRSEKAAEEHEKQEATEQINLKITNSQIQTYAKKGRLPTLQEIADDFCEDDEIQYVELKSKKIASLKKIDIGNNESILTKLKNYDYEFEINSDLKLASINRVKIAEVQTEPSNVLFEGKSTNGGKIILKDKLTNYSFIEVYFRNIEQRNASPIQKFTVQDIVEYKRMTISENALGWGFGSTYDYNEEENALTNSYNMLFGGAQYYYFERYCLEIYKIVGIK